MAKDAYTLELAATVDKLFGEGVTDPNAREIAESHFGTDILGGEIVDGVQKRLKAIQNILTDPHYGHQICSVSPKYYLKTAKRPNYRDQPPETDAEARSCLPMGHGVRAIGLKLCIGGDDRIYQAALTQGFASGGAKLKANLDRAVEGYAAGHIPEDKTVALLQDAKAKATPIHAVEVEQMVALPKP